MTKEAGLPGFRFHDLRHTAITELAESGAADATLMAIAGHMMREMLEHYPHVRMQTKRAALDGISSGLMGERGDADAPSATVQQRRLGGGYVTIDVTIGDNAVTDRL